MGARFIKEHARGVGLVTKRNNEFKISKPEIMTSKKSPKELFGDFFNEIVYQVQNNEM